MADQRPKPWRRGERLTADRLNQMIGLGIQNPSTFAGLRWFEAQEAFAATEDVYSGACKELWLSGTSYATRGDDIDVYSRDDGVADGDQFCGMWNVQSGRWERISGGGTSCTESLRIYINTIVNSADITGNFTVKIKYDSTDYDVTYAHNATNADVKSAFDTAMTAASVTVTVTGTRLTGVTEVTFPDMSLLVLDRESTHTLEDSNADDSMIHLKVVKCCL